MNWVTYSIWYLRSVKKTLSMSKSKNSILYFQTSFFKIAYFVQKIHYIRFLHQLFNNLYVPLFDLSSNRFYHWFLHQKICCTLLQKKVLAKVFSSFVSQFFSRFQNFSRFGPNLILSQKSHQNVFLLNAYEHQWEVWTIRVFTLFSRYKLQRLCSHRKVSALTEEKFVRRNGRVGLRKKEREI